MADEGAAHDRGQAPREMDGQPSGCSLEAPPAADGLLGRLRAELDRRGLATVDAETVPAPDPAGRTHAAVLVLLYPHRSGPRAALRPHLALTRRTEALPRHGGQISLPGGRWDPEDGSLLHTALREAQEELGLDPAQLEMWGYLEPEYIVVSQNLVAPFVAYSPRRPAFCPAPGEVAELIEVPLALLVEPTTLAEEIWEIRGAPRQVSFYRHGEHKIWGATARVLGKLVALLTPEPAAHATARLEPGTVFPEGSPGED